MKLDKNGYQLISEFEGLSLKPYLDSIKVPTIGYGNTFYLDGRKVTMQDKSISKDEAFEMFKIIADRFAAKVSALLKKDVSQNKFNAMVSLAYNIGLGNFQKSTLLRKANVNPNDASIRLEFMKWNKAGGKIITGLTNRRNKEATIYFT